MITLHHLNNSRSQRIIWLLEELNLDFEIRSYERDLMTYQAPESLKKIHPLGKAPVLEDAGQVIAESAVIIDYLINQYALHLKPSGEYKEQLSYQYWMHYAEASLMPFMVMKLVFEKIKTSPMPFFAKPIAKIIVNKANMSFIAPNIATHMQYIEKHLSEREWFCGNEISGADFQMIFPLEAAVARNLVNNEEYPNIVRYVRQVHSRPAYQAALDVSGDYDYA